MPALRFGDWLLLPNLGESLLPSSDLVCAFEAFADLAGAQANGTIAITKDAQPVMEIPLQVSRQPESGRIAYVGHIPIGTLPPGSYALVLTLRQGAATLTRTAPFTLSAAAP